MKILYIYKNVPGGIKTYVDNLSEYFIKKKHIVYFYDINNLNTNSNNKIKNKIKNIIHLLYPKFSVKEFQRILYKSNPDIIHFNHFDFIFVPSMLNEIKKWKQKTNQKCTVLYTAHGFNLICANHMLYNSKKKTICEKCLYKNCFFSVKEKCLCNNFMKNIIYAYHTFFWKYISNTYKVIDTILCCSEFIKNKIDIDKRLNNKTVVLHNFVFATDKQTENIKQNYVLYFGRYSTEKGIDTLIEICKKLTSINFIFAGYGSLEKKLIGIKNIKNVGYKSGNELKELIVNACFSICPSECYDNCPFSVIESQMYGTPVLGAKIGGIPELIDVEQTGELFESGNKEDLANHIIHMWNNKEKLKKYAENCKNKRFITIEEYYKILVNNYYI